MCVIRRLLQAPLQLAILICFAVVSSSLGYGPLGHEIVGAIADRKLAGTPTAAKIKTLLGGRRLNQNTLIADDIKSWDKNGPDDRRGIHFLAHPEIEQQLHDFWKANPPSPDSSDTTPSHHWMHYTDVPVLDVEKYGDGKTGRGNWDIVHTIPYCIGVLRGEVSADNPRKITKAIAVILLAHYLGDIHQPLHVGAEYFNDAGEPIDPDRGAPGLGDEGGNALSLVQNGPMRLARSHARRTRGCDLSMSIARRKMVAFLPKEKRTKSGLATWIGQLPLPATNCTRPVGAWRICCKKFCSRVSMRRAEIFRQARTLALQEAQRLRLRRDHIRSSFSS